MTTKIFDEWGVECERCTGFSQGGNKWIKTCECIELEDMFNPEELEKMETGADTK